VLVEYNAGCNIGMSTKYSLAKGIGFGDPTFEEVFIIDKGYCVGGEIS
jgi:hypothetical protein